MTADLRIARMTLGDLERTLEWAAIEGWNPGLDDATAFHATDPGGFLMGWLGPDPVAAISITRHNATFAFLGLYITQPEYRGRGIGRVLWTAALTLAGTRAIGLDGVPAQQPNYATAGFVPTHRAIRFTGTVTPAQTAAQPVTASMLPDLIARDARLSGILRPAYLSAWFTDAPTRHTRVLTDGDRITAVGTIRACREAHKIGPLYAETPEAAQTLLRALATLTPAGRIIIDMPDSNPDAMTLAQNLGLTPSFEVARMIRGRPPTRAPSGIFGEVTLELG